VSGATEQLKLALADRYVIEREPGAGGMATATDGRRFYFATEDRHSDVYVADLIPQ
jgi:hypothetical protein